MREMTTIFLLSALSLSLGGEPKATAPEQANAQASREATPKPDLTGVVADIREVNVKLETVCRMQYGDGKCSVKSTNPTAPVVGTLP